MRCVFVCVCACGGGVADVVVDVVDVVGAVGVVGVVGGGGVGGGAGRGRGQLHRLGRFQSSYYTACDAGGGGVAALCRRGDDTPI